jgi:FkbM family methyltransferase
VNDAVKEPAVGEVLAAVNELTRQVADLRRAVAEIRVLVGPFGTPMPGERMLVQTIYGTKYLIDPHDLIMAPQLIVYRQWEEDLSQYVIANVNRDTIFVDVGANFGYFTCLVGSRIGTGGIGHVIAVEPNPRLVPLLRANTQINWSMCPIDIHAVAAGASNRMVALEIPRDRAANASISRHEGAVNTDRVEVEQRELDSLVAPGTAVDLMKVDVEGHEYGVLEGARRVIAESPNLCILMEWSVTQMVDAGYPPDTMVALLKRLGLAPFTLPAKAGEKPAPMDPAVLLQTAYANVLLRRSAP